MFKALIEANVVKDTTYCFMSNLHELVMSNGTMISPAIETYDLPKNPNKQLYDVTSPDDVIINSVIADVDCNIIWVEEITEVV